MIPVTQPFLPPQKEYQKLLAEVWERNWLTNNGPLVQQLEKRLTEYLHVPYLSFVSNGTIAQQIAMKALNLEGEIITTPFSYVATTSSIVWENHKPVFVDIDPETFNIDPQKIEYAISPETSAIVATHVYGNPCNIEGIQKVADKNDLKVIYDAAHCFGTQYKRKSVFSFGDLSVTSFHATKLYHTVEGGAIITDNQELLKKSNLMRNFGHNGLNNFTGVGINGKNSEFHAAMGLVNLNYIDEVLDQRKRLSGMYNEALQGLNITKQHINPKASYNFSYYPVLFENEEITELVVSNLKDKEIQARRYFYPLLSTLEYVDRDPTPIAESISKRILCLPLYHSLQEVQIEQITDIIKETI